MWHQPVSVTNAGDGGQDHHLNSATRHQQGISHSAAAAHVQAAGIRDAMTRTLMPSPYGPPPGHVGYHTPHPVDHISPIGGSYHPHITRAAYNPISFHPSHVMGPPLSLLDQHDNSVQYGIPPPRPGMGFPIQHRYAMHHPPHTTIHSMIDPMTAGMHHFSSVPVEMMHHIPIGIGAPHHMHARPMDSQGTPTSVYQSSMNQDDATRRALCAHLAQITRPDSEWRHPQESDMTSEDLAMTRQN